MEAFKTVIWIINIFSSLAIIALVLMQHGKGADAGASFGGSGSAQGVFGSSGNANFLTRMTAISAMVFFGSCLALGYVNTNSGSKVGSVDFSTVQQSGAASSVQPSVPIMQTASETIIPQSASNANNKTDADDLKAVATTAAAVTAAKVVASKTNDPSKDKKDKKATDKKSDASKTKKSVVSEKNKSSTQTDNKKQ